MSCRASRWQSHVAFAPADDERLQDLRINGSPVNNRSRNAFLYSGDDDNDVVLSLSECVLTRASCCCICRLQFSAVLKKTRALSWQRTNGRRWKRVSIIKVVSATVGLLYADRDPSLCLTPRQSNPLYVQPFRGENATIQSFRHS